MSERARSRGGKVMAERLKKSPAGGWRCNVVFGLLLMALVGLGVRLALLIRCGRSEAIASSRRQQRMVIPLPARPGNIWARAGGGHVLLAGSKQVPGCYGDPLLLRDRELAPVAVAVGDILGVDPVELQRKLIARRRARFVWLKRDITAAQAEAIRALRNRAVAVAHQWRREYPNGPLAAAVVGFRTLDGRGGGAMELAAEKYLAATDGRRVVLADALRRPIWPMPQHSRPPRDGSNVFLYLDTVIQGYLEKAVGESVERFDAEWAAGVVVDPQTGEVLAMCSLPGFDPGKFNQADPANRTDRAICTPYEPGSALKPILAAAAVQAGLLNWDSRIFCENGLYRAHRGGRISDHGSRYGWLSLTDVVVHSSNIGMAKVGERLGNRRMHAAVRAFGLGERTGVGLPGESPGIVRPLGQWDGYSLRRVPFGQEISVTSLQLAMAFSALANGGLLLRPRLIDCVVGADGRVVWRSRPEVVRRVLSRPVAQQALDVLRQVVERGTGKRCRLRRWTSFGKTGTAQIAGVGGYVDGAYAGTFVGGAPAERPRLLVLITIYRPDRSKGYYGATVAAPYVKDVLQQSLGYLGVPEDRGLHTAVAAR